MWNWKKKDTKERKTFVMFWNPAISNWTLKDNTRAINNEFLQENDWAIWDYSDAKPGDRFFMVRCGAGKTGVFQSGFLRSEAYKGEDWSGRDRDVHYVDLLTRVIIDPEHCPILTTDVLRRELPGFDWTGGHSGRLLAPEMADRLEELWSRFLEENEDMFNRYALNYGDYPMDDDDDDPFDEDDEDDDNDNDNDDDDYERERTAEVSLTETGAVKIEFNDGGITFHDLTIVASTLAKAKEYFADRLRAHKSDMEGVKFEYLCIDEENYELYDKVLTLVTEKHKGQRDKAGMPYMGHLARVAENCVMDEVKMVALMHDLVEDTDVDEAFLLSYGIPEEMVDAVLTLTKREGEDYADFIERVSNHPVAKEVKLADLEDNMNITRLHELKVEDLHRLQKYLDAWKLLKRED